MSHAYTRLIPESRAVPSAIHLFECFRHQRLPSNLPTSRAIRKMPPGSWDWLVCASDPKMELWSEDSKINNYFLSRSLAHFLSLLRLYCCSPSLSVYSFSSFSSSSLFSFATFFVFLRFSLLPLLRRKHFSSSLFFVVFLLLQACTFISSWQ